MKGKRPLVVLLAAILAIGLVGVFAAAPVAAQTSDDDTNENECEVEAENEATQTNNAVGALISSSQNNLADQDAQASINNFAKVQQANWQSSTQQAAGSNVAQSSDQDASNTAKVSQCEANQNA